MKVTVSGHGVEPNRQKLNYNNFALNGSNKLTEIIHLFLGNCALIVYLYNKIIKSGVDQYGF
jgi:hypothetical protein